MDLSIVILNYKSKGLLKQCLRGIYQSKPDCSYECIVVDNASGDDLQTMIEEELFPQGSATLWDAHEQPIHVIERKKNDGYARGNNEGIKKAIGDHILILNPDVAVFKNSLEPLIKYLKDHPEVAVVGPKLKNPDGSIQYSSHAFPSISTPFYRRTILGKTQRGKKALRNYLMVDWDRNEPKDVDWLMGSALMLRRKAIEEVGLFDERFFMYFEDIDWCRRFWKAGWRVTYVPDSHMVHYHHRTSASVSLKTFFRNKPARAHIASAIKYFWKYRHDNHPRDKQT